MTRAEEPGCLDKEELRAEAITQSELPEALKKGLITEAEVQKIWRKTEHLSAQTPIEVRVAVIKMLEHGYKVPPAQQMILSTVLDLRAALYRDESKFAHLVAGTEEIVSKLKGINKWENLVEQLNGKIDQLTILVNGLIDGRNREKGIEPEDYQPEFETAKIGPVESYVGPYDPLSPYEPIVEEEYDRKIGSNWDPRNPRKK